QYDPAVPACNQGIRKRREPLGGPAPQRSARSRMEPDDRAVSGWQLGEQAPRLALTAAGRRELDAAVTGIRAKDAREAEPAFDFRFVRDVGKTERQAIIVQSAIAK